MKNPDVSPLEIPLPIRPKNAFEEALDKLDLQGILLMLTVLSQKALYLQSQKALDTKPILKPTVIHKL